MQSRFHKMHGLGNDFVIIDARETPVAMPQARAQGIADRHTGIGCDQLIVLEPSAVADVRMRIFNADGGEVEACGNATRCVAVLLGVPARIETAGGLLETVPEDSRARITLPPPRFDWADIPLAMPLDTADLPLNWDDLARPVAVNVGNPHVVFFVPDAEAVPLDRLGPIFEHDPLFPQRVNVNVASVVGPGTIRLRVWERGVGLTQACGTGACATAVAARRRHLVSGPVTVQLDGGALEIDWQPGQPIVMSGSATHVFTGTADWSQFG